MEQKNEWVKGYCNPDEESCDIYGLLAECERSKEKEVLEKMKQLIKKVYPEHDPKDNHACKAFYNDCACSTVTDCLNTVLETINSRLAEIENK